MEIEIYQIIIIVFFISIIIYWLTVIFQFSKKRKLDNGKILFYKKLIKKTSSLNSDKEQIVEYDKIFHNILKDLWYEWTFWEILKIYPNEIDNIEKVWELHKLRNKLVHDFDLISPQILKKKSSEYRKEINKFLY